MPLKPSSLHVLQKITSKEILWKTCSLTTSQINWSTSFSTYPLGDSVDLWTVLPSAHHLETPVTRKQIRREREGEEEDEEEEGERDVSESTVQTTDTEKQTVPAKAFPTQMNGRGLEAPAQPNTLNICTLIVFHCLGHSRPSHSQAFKIPSSPSNRSLTSIKKRQKTSPWCTSSSELSLSQPVYSHPAWRDTHREAFDGSSESVVFLTCDSAQRRLVYVKQTSQWGLSNSYFEWRIITRWKFPCR